MHCFVQTGPGGQIEVIRLEIGRPLALWDRDWRAYEGEVAGVPQAVLVPYRAPRGPATALVVGGSWEIQVNRKRVLGRLQVLADRDVVEGEGFRLWFGAVSPPRPVEAPAEVQCLCGDPIPGGSQAVECGCGGLFHLECWEGEATCPLCERPTAYHQPWPWVPEGFCHDQNDVPSAFGGPAPDAGRRCRG